jgi:hypothetical protein
MDDDDEDTAAMMLIPLLWATKMMEANNEFLAELASMMPLNDPKDVLKRMLAKHQSTH